MNFHIGKATLPRYFALSALIICAAHAQSIVGRCVVSAQAPQLRAEGLTEPLGELSIFCSGFAANAAVNGNFTFFYPASVTNRIDDNGLTTQAVLSVDYGLGLTPLPVAGSVNDRVLSFNGVQLTAPAGGSFTLNLSKVRIAANQLGPSTHLATVSFSAPLQVNTAQATVGNVVPGLFTAMAGAGINCVGSQLPSTLSLANLFDAKTAFSSTRVTEGFGSAFTVRGTGEDNGTRILLKYSGFPANAHIYLPDMVAGSDATVPTAGGDLSNTQSVGQYVPGSSTLLLVRVPTAGPSGGGGIPLATPIGAGPVMLNSVSEVPLTNGSGYAVYEVADANSSILENAQVPTFIAIDTVTTPAVAQETVSLAPASTVASASSTDPIPRFLAVTPPSDCSLVGDCQATYFPKLDLDLIPIQLTGIAGGSMTGQPGSIGLANAGGGTLVWNSAVNYVDGSGWLALDPPSGAQSARIRVSAQPQKLAVGTYRANVVIDAGPVAGNKTIPVTLTVQPAPPPLPTVTITSIINAATFANTALVPGSVATLKGTHLAGTNVAVTLSSQPAALLFTSDVQINFQVPDGLIGQPSATVVVTVDGVSSAPATAVLAPAGPAIFGHAVRNQDWSENLLSTPAAAGSYLQIFGLGMPPTALITAQIGTRTNLVPAYAGPAPGFPGIQQVNVQVPSDLAPGVANLILCATVNGTPYCSDPYPLTTN